MGGKIAIRTELLAAVAKWTCFDKSRHHHHVLFDGEHMVATDGHRLVTVTCRTGLPPFAIHREDCFVIAAAQRELKMGRRAEVALVEVTAGPAGRATFELDDDRRVLTVRTDDGKSFPHWQKLFEDLKAETPTPPAYAFEPRYLADIDEVIRAVTGDVQRTVEVKAWTAKAPDGFCGPMLFEGLVFEGAHGYEMRFLVMPKRS